MKTISYSFLFFALFLFAACQNEQAKPTTEQEAPAAETPKRIVSLNGSLTELLYQLDLGQNIVGVDVTSSYPEAAQALPKLGHVNKLNVEAVLALNPNYILVDSNALASPAIQQLAQSAEIEVLAVPVPQRLDGAVTSAKALAQKLPIAPEKIEALEEEIKKDQNALKEFLAQQKASPKVLFIYARGSKVIMAAGPNTAMAKMIKLAGGQNAVDDFEDFKPLTPESVLASQPMSYCSLILDSPLWPKPKNLQMKPCSASPLWSKRPPPNINALLVWKDIISLVLDQEPQKPL